MKALVTGGAGFIGTNLVDHLLSDGHHVTIYDNLSRRGASRNLEWLRTRHRLGDRFQFVEGDVRDSHTLAMEVRGVDAIFHFAAQVAVTTSVTDPLNDFEVNALGTLNVLEAARRFGSEPLVVFTSTNKVYGGMEDARIVERDTRYEYADNRYRSGVDEDRPLDFHSPYGCSKGAADQYVRDYYRIYGLRTTVFRMSCIYGPRQFGNEDQGWVAHFVIAAVLGLPVTIYGNGKQVRDILYVEDLVRAFELVASQPERAAGKIYNVGGGPDNTIAIWSEFGEILQDLTGTPIRPAWGDWRPGDQLVYVTDTSRIRRDLGWSPRVSARDGIARLYNWVQANRSEIASAVVQALV